MTSETSDKAQIQALINGIDEALNKTNPRLPWVMSNDAAQQRQVLEQTRQYLTALQQQTEADRLSRSVGETVPQLSAALNSPPQLPESPSESAQQVLQAVLQEMNYWRVNMLQPLRSEIDSLQRQREMLTQEIRQMEVQRQQQGLGAQPNQQLLMEFLQSAMAQMQANLSGQVTQMIASQMQLDGQPALSASAALTPAERLAQMQTAQTQSDQLMLKLDSTLQVIFESLNRNVQTYEESLEQGLNRMHSLGQQGEAMFAFLVNRLAQQLGREASTFLQASTGNWQQSSSLPAEPQANPSNASPASEVADAKVSDFLSQIPDPSQLTFVPAVPFDLTEEVLDISELELLDQPLDQPLEQPSPDSALAGLDREINQLELGAISPTPETPPFDLFTGNQPLPDSKIPNSETATRTASTPTMSDLDSALDLLNQLSAEMQSNLAMEEEKASSTDASTQSSTALSSETEFITIPDSLYDDAFYSNLYSDPTADAAPVGKEPPSDATPIDAMTLEQAWFDGLGDPAAEVLPTPTPQPDFSSSSVSQSLETFLLSNPNPAPADPDVFAEFDEFPASQPTPEAVQSDLSESESFAISSETIASLSELISPDARNLDPSNLNSSQRAAHLDTAKFDPELSEPLPIAEAPLENFQVDLGSDADVLTQLGADLAQFGASAAPPEPKETGWDLFADLPNADSSTPNPASEPNSNPPAVTIEGLEDLFADVPSENPTQIEATPDLFAQLKAAFSQDLETPIEIEQPIVLKYIDSDSADASDSEKKK